MSRFTRRAWLAASALAGVAVRGQNKAPAPAADPGVFKAAGSVPDGAILPVGEGPMKDLRWRLRYEYDELNRRCQLQGFAMPGPSFGLGVLVVVDTDDDRPRPMMLITRDGGAKWELKKWEKDPLGVAVHGDRHAWVVHPGKLYFTEDAGQKWIRYDLPTKEMSQVYFLSEQTGWAYGRGKSFYRTDDGGKTWNVVLESARLELQSHETYLRSMTAAPSGAIILVGDSTAQPPEAGRYPDWMAPEQAIRRKLLPGTVVIYESHDGGQSWHASLSSAFGQVKRARLGAGRAVAVFEYGDSFPWPSELYQFDLKARQLTTILRRKELMIQDAILLEGGGLMVAAIQPNGRLRNSPIPSRLRILWTPDRTGWYEMKVDYRATGRQATFVTCADNTMWVATDEGVLLQLA